MLIMQLETIQISQEVKVFINGKIHFAFEHINTAGILFIHLFYLSDIDFI